MNETDQQKSSTPEEYLSTTLHELRTPLMIIKSWVTILSDEKTKELHPKAIEGISQAIEMLEDVCDGMAGYYRELMKKQ